MDKETRKAFGPKLSAKELRDFVVCIDGELHWLYRDPKNPAFDNPKIPEVYRKTCGLFNRKFKREKVDWPSFTCFGVRYDTAEVVQAIRALCDEAD